MDETIVRVQHIRKRFGGARAVDDVSFAVRRSEILAVVGANGAGKSTLLRIIAGLATQDQGLVSLGSRRIDNLAPFRRQQLGLGFSFQLPPTPMTVTVSEYLHLADRLRRGSKDRMQVILDRFGLAPYQDTRCSQLDHTHRRKLDIACALLSGPVALLLDEPSSGLALEESLELFDALKELCPGVGMVLVEHDLGVVQAVADSVLLLDAGRTAKIGSWLEVSQSVEFRQAYGGFT